MASMAGRSRLGNHNPGVGPEGQASEMPTGTLAPGGQYVGETAASYGRRTQRGPAIPELHVLWLTAGLSCDGDTVAITAATQPSLEDVVLGAIPGLPRVHLHHPVLAYEVGEDFLKAWHRAAEGQLDPFVLVVEGSIP